MDFLAKADFELTVPGVGSKGIILMNAYDLEEALKLGTDWSLTECYVWSEDKERCEKYGRILNADPSKGAGNYYGEIQVVDVIFDKWSTSKMGIEDKVQVVVMINSESRGFGHQVATDALVQMEKSTG
ncbi:hypothetical protein GQX74_010899 [Glossina fuscipes]|nr:hypothetical protein GQX74_010899 [Glossina fuscipes]